MIRPVSLTSGWEEAGAVDAALMSAPAMVGALCGSPDRLGAAGVSVETALADSAAAGVSSEMGRVDVSADAEAETERDETLFDGRVVAAALLELPRPSLATGVGSGASVPLL
jgi:hypothetical protein